MYKDINIFFAVLSFYTLFCIKYLEKNQKIKMPLQFLRNEDIVKEKKEYCE